MVGVRIGFCFFNPVLHIGVLSNSLSMNFRKFPFYQIITWALSLNYLLLPEI